MFPQRSAPNIRRCRGWTSRARRLLILGQALTAFLGPALFMKFLLLRRWIRSCACRLSSVGHSTHCRGRLRNPPVARVHSVCIAWRRTFSLVRGSRSFTTEGIIAVLATVGEDFCPLRGGHRARSFWNLRPRCFLNVLFKILERFKLLNRAALVHFCLLPLSL